MAQTSENIKKKIKAAFWCNFLLGALALKKSPSSKQNDETEL